MEVVTVVQDVAVNQVDQMVLLPSEPTEVEQGTKEVIVDVRVVG